MRSPSHAIAAIVATLLAALLAMPIPAAAQEADATGETPHDEEFIQPGVAAPLAGHTRSDGTIVLADQAFCSFLLGSIWGADELTPLRLVDRTKKQRKARRGAFQPASDPASLEACATALGAYRVAAPAEDDPVAAWARSAPVVPEALADLLPADLLADPLAEPEPVGDGSRTSGFGARTSAPFGLSGGTYYVEVDAAGCASWAAAIRGVRDPGLELGPVEDQGYLYDVPPATYYWEVQAPDCEWSVDLVAVDLGPEPTPTPPPMSIVPKLIADGPLHIEAERQEFFAVAAARQAVLEAGLTTGTCEPGSAQYIGPGFVVSQDPPFGSVVEPGTPVNVTATSDCDIYLGERIVVE